jgi:hypothetical protein
VSMGCDEMATLFPDMILRFSHCGRSERTGVSWRAVYYITVLKKYINQTSPTAILQAYTATGLGT